MIKALRDAYAPILERLIGECKRKAEAIGKTVGERYLLAAGWMAPALELHKRLAQTTERLIIEDDDPLRGAVKDIPYSELPLTTLGGRRIIEPWQFKEAAVASAQDAFNNYVWARSYEAAPANPMQFDFEVEFRIGRSDARVPAYLFGSWFEAVHRLMRRGDFVRVRITAATPEAPLVYEAHGSTPSYRRHHWAAAKMAGEEQLRADIIADAVLRR